MQGISWLDEELLASQEGLCPMQFISCILKKEGVFRQIMGNYLPADMMSS